MKHASTVALTVIVTFLVSVALNFGFSYLTQDNGSVMVGPTTTISGKPYTPVVISNFTSDPLDDLVLSVPRSISPSDVIASDAVRVSDEPGSIATADKKQISVSGIGHNRVTILQLPIAAQNDGEPNVEVMNARQKHLTPMSDRDISYPSFQILGEALATGVMSGLIYTLVLLWWYTKAAGMESRMSALHAETLDLKKQQDQIVDDTKKKFRRVQIVLFARLTDYSRELRFWRDTMRKVLYGLTGGQEAGDTIIKHVTESLQTYGTRTDYEPQFETLEVLAGLIFKAESNPDKGSDGRS